MSWNWYWIVQETPSVRHCLSAPCSILLWADRNIKRLVGSCFLFFLIYSKLNFSSPLTSYWNGWDCQILIKNLSHSLTENVWKYQIIGDLKKSWYFLHLIFSLPLCVHVSQEKQQKTSAVSSIPCLCSSRFKNFFSILT